MAEVNKSNITTRPDLKRLWKVGSWAQAVVVVAQVAFFIIALSAPAIPVVGRSAPGVYATFNWVIFVPLFDVLALTFAWRYKLRTSIFYKRVSLLLFFLGSLGFSVFGWMDFCCTDQGVELGQRLIPIIWGSAILFYYLPTIINLFCFMKLNNLIIKTSSQGRAPNQI